MKRKRLSTSNLTTAYQRSARAILLLSVLLIGGCASAPVDRDPVRSSIRRQASASKAAGLHSVVDGRFRNLKNGETIPSAEGTSEEVRDVSAMTYAASTRRFYAIADATSKPRLVAFNPANGAPTPIGPIEAPGLDLTLAEAIAAHPKDGSLYVAGGDSTFASNVLLRVDPATGKARQVAGIGGTIQDEIDAMTFVDDVLYAIDGAGKSAALYRIDIETGEASRVTRPFTAAVTDLAFDDVRHQLVGAQGTGRPLLGISLDGRARDLSGAATGLSVVAIIPTSASVFEDGFESGDASAWATPSKKKKKKP